MKIFRTVLTLALAFAGASLLQAQVANVPIVPQGLSAVTVGTTNGNTALSWTIIPARSANGGTPVVTYLNASSDLAFSQVNAYVITTNTTANFTNTTTSLPVAQTNGCASGDVIIIRHLLDENYEKRVLTTFTSSTNLTVTVAPMESVIPGDIIYRCTTTGAPAVVMVTTNISLTATAPILAGQKGFPLMLEVSATSKGAINAATAIWLP